MNGISRRAFIAASAAVTGAVMLPRWTMAQETPESAFLQAEVDAGNLPPVAERLPVNPLVVSPLERPGTQGGDWRHALVGGGSLSMLVRYQGYEPLVRFDPEWNGILANAAESYEINADATEYTIKLRAGHKWSDGHPYTTADIQFWYDAYFNDEETNLGSQAFLEVDGVKATLEVVDETTFKLKFIGPNGFLLQQLAWAQNDQMTRAPKHYLEKFHIRYNPDADALAKAQGMESWIALFQREVGFQDDNTFFQNANRPTLNAWAFNSGAPGQNTEQAVATRNPYYFKVDTNGTQLPYFDRVVYQMVADPEVLLLKTLQGEIDMMDQYICTPANRPTLYDGMETGNYGFYTLRETAANVMAFQLNLNHVDETKRTLFNTIEFRHALSLAVDRQALIDAVFIGQGVAAQPSIIETDPLYNEQLAKQFIEYDPDTANAMLDALAPERDGEGYRLDAEGRRIAIIFELDQTRTTFLDMFQLAIPMFQAVGIDVQMRTMDRSLWEERVRRGREYDATAHQFGANSGIAAMLDARFYVPTNSNCFYAPGWSLYYTQPDNPAAIEPPEAVKAQQELYRDLAGTADPVRQNEIMAEILQNAADLFFTFGVSLPADGYGIVKNEMVNVMDLMPNSFGWPTPGPARPEQFFKA